MDIVISIEAILSKWKVNIVYFDVNEVSYCH